MSLKLPSRHVDIRLCKKGATYTVYKHTQQIVALREWTGQGKEL